jgi:CRP/FNR family transcriptional regulator
VTRAAGREDRPGLPPDHPCASCPVRLQTFCGKLDERELATFKLLGASGRAVAGQCLFHEDDRAGAVYNLTAGTLKLYRLLPDGRRQIASFRRAGEFIGLTLERVHTHTAEAVERVDFCRFRRDRFDRFVEEHPAIGRELHRKTQEALAAARRQVVLLGRKTAAERLAAFLTGRSGAATGGRLIVLLPMTRTDIADHLGLTKETVSRTFADFRRRGLIATAPGAGVELLQHAALEQLACGAQPHLE